jgi:hypothetical protein
VGIKITVLWVVTPRNSVERLYVWSNPVCLSPVLLSYITAISECTVCTVYSLHSVQFAQMFVFVDSDIFTAKCFCYS